MSSIPESNFLYGLHDPLLLELWQDAMSTYSHAPDNCGASFPPSIHPSPLESVQCMRYLFHSPTNCSPHTVPNQVPYYNDNGARYFNDSVLNNSVSGPATVRNHTFTASLHSNNTPKSPVLGHDLKSLFPTNGRGQDSYDHMNTQFESWKWKTRTPDLQGDHVGSQAITFAALGNRKKEPTYFCQVPGCTSKGFTAKHSFDCF